MERVFLKIDCWTTIDSFSFEKLEINVIAKLVVSSVKRSFKRSY